MNTGQRESRLSDYLGHMLDALRLARSYTGNQTKKQWCLTPFRELATIKQSRAHADTTLTRHPACFGLATITENAWRREEKSALLPIHA